MKRTLMILLVFGFAHISNAQNAGMFQASQTAIPSFNLNLQTTNFPAFQITGINRNPSINLFLSAGNILVFQLPVYTQGLFCDFEDHINRNRKLRIDFGVK